MLAESAHDCAVVSACTQGWLLLFNARAPHLAGRRHVPAMNGGGLEDDIVGRGRCRVAPAGRVAEECTNGRNEPGIAGACGRSQAARAGAASPVRQAGKKAVSCRRSHVGTWAANMAAPAGLWARMRPTILLPLTFSVLAEAWQPRRGRPAGPKGWSSRGVL